MLLLSTGNKDFFQTDMSTAYRFEFKQLHSVLTINMWISWKHFPHHWPFLKVYMSHWWWIPSQRSSNAELWFSDVCLNKLLKNSKVLVISDSIMLIWHRCHDMQDSSISSIDGKYIAVHKIKYICVSLLFVAIRYHPYPLWYHNITMDAYVI